MSEEVKEEKEESKKRTYDVLFQEAWMMNAFINFLKVQRLRCHMLTDTLYFDSEDKVRDNKTEGLEEKKDESPEAAIED